VGGGGRASLCPAADVGCASMTTAGSGRVPRAACIAPCMAAQAHADSPGTGVAYVPASWRGRAGTAESHRHAPRGPHGVAGRQLGGNNLRIVAGGGMRSTRGTQPCNDSMQRCNKMA
jgi:hypothetical protein